MQINKKKLKKNLPYLFVVLALICIVGLRVAYQQSGYNQISTEAPAEPTEEQKARMFFSGLYDAPAALPDKAPDGSYVFAGAFTTAADGSVSFKAPENLPKASYPNQSVSLIFDFDQLPRDPAVIEKHINDVRKSWRRNDFKVYSLVARYTGDTVDSAQLDKLTSFLRQRFKSAVGTYLKSAWFNDDKDSQIMLSNIGKSVMNFIYEEKDIRAVDETLASAIRRIDKRKVGFMVIVETKPDLVALRNEINDTTNFGGLIIRNPQ